MNPQVLFWYQQLIQMGYPQAQALQFAQQMAQYGGGQQQGGQGGPGAPASDDLQSQLAAILGTGAGINALSGPLGLEKQAAETSMNPTALNQRINQFTKNLSPNLIHAVTRATTPGIAERGLATSPGASQQIIAEALAPYELQEQQMGTQLAQSSFEPAFAYGSGLGSVNAGQQEDLAQLIGLLGSHY